MSPAVSIRVASTRDLSTCRDLLVAAGLPVQDLEAQRFDDFLVAEHANDIVGLIGLEKFAGTGLLRSLVVDAAYRGSGLGRELVAELEAAAMADGVIVLWLLTTDADRFFAQLGYAVAGRDAAPAAITQTAEFSDLCPGDAVLMQKSLDRRTMSG